MCAAADPQNLCLTKAHLLENLERKDPSMDSYKQCSHRIMESQIKACQVRRGLKDHVVQPSLKEAQSRQNVLAP